MQGTVLLVFEAALLLEEHYEEICDELWYIYTEKSVRMQRLKEARGYTDTKVQIKEILEKMEIQSR